MGGSGEWAVLGEGYQVGLGEREQSGLGMERHSKAHDRLCWSSLVGPGWGCEPGCGGCRGRLSPAVLSLTPLSSCRGSHLTDVSTGGARGAWAHSWSGDTIEAMGLAGHWGGPGFGLAWRLCTAGLFRVD